MICEYILRSLEEKFDEEHSEYGEDYPLYASYELVPGNIYDAILSVRNEILFDGSASPQKEKTRCMWGRIYRSADMMKALWACYREILGTDKHAIQVHNDVPASRIPNCVRQSHFVVKEERANFQKNQENPGVPPVAYRFLQAEEEKGDRPGVNEQVTTTGQLVCMKMIQRNMRQGLLHSICQLSHSMLVILETQNEVVKTKLENHVPYNLPNCDHFPEHKCLNMDDGEVILPMSDDEMKKIRKAVFDMVAPKHLIKNTIVIQGPKAEAFSGKYVGYEHYDTGRAKLAAMSSEMGFVVSTVTAHNFYASVFPLTLSMADILGRPT